MEQHPIPRDVTGFQFKLVGTMTLKQFGYVAFGAIIGYVCFKAPIGIFQLPLAGLFWFLGFALAFIPIQERPLDRWLGAFIKSVYSPTQFIWKKIPPEIEILSQLSQPKKKDTTHLVQYKDSREKLNKYLTSLPLPLEEELDQKEKEVLSRALSFFQMPAVSKKTAQPQLQAKPQPQPAEKSPALPTPPPPLKKTKPIIPPPLKAKKETVKQEAPKQEEDRSSYEKNLQKKIEDLKKELELKTLSKSRFLEISEQLTSSLEEKRRLEKEVGTLRKKAAIKKEDPVIPTAKLDEEKSRVKIITPKLASKMGMPNIPQSPNIISGIVKDPAGKLLPGMIITVKNTGGVTMRALKTNNVGLFVSATSLASGVYTLEVEDPQKKYEFDIIKTTLGGEIYSPLEILARGEREQTRESLTKELFGQV